MGHVQLTAKLTLCGRFFNMRLILRSFFWKISKLEIDKISNESLVVIAFIKKEFGPYSRTNLFMWIVIFRLIWEKIYF
ncbi:hypothetical protein GGR92_004045 [Spirosoma lacussanchae]